MNDTIECPECGQANPINFSTCLNCSGRLKNSKYFQENYKDFYEIFSQENHEIMEKYDITETAYDTIINSIINIGEDYIQLLPEEASISNLFNITRPYVKILYDNSKNFPSYLSYYSYDNIMIKKSTDAKLIPTAILHEFTHHLFNEMIKQALMHQINHEKNLLIESFGWYVSVKDKYAELTSEFMAHKIQEHFLPDDFEGYTSVIKLLQDNPNLEEEEIKKALYFGNALSKDIIHIMEHFITPKTSMYGGIFANTGIEYPIIELSVEEKIEQFNALIKDSYNEIMEDKVEMQNTLSQINKNFIYMNC